jgi:hypothetical protein
MRDHQGQFEYRRFHAMRIAAMIVGGVVMACVFALAFGWLVMLLWNWLMPMLFGLKGITYWQAFGIVILSKLLFSGVGGHHKGHHGPYGHHGFHRGPKPWGHDHRDDWIPAGDPRNWMYYRDYWKDRGKKNFEEYLNEKGHASDVGKDEQNDRS